MHKSHPLVAAMRRKFKTPEAAVRAMGLDARLLRDEEEREGSMTTRYSRSRRMARDQEEGREEMKELLDDPNATFSDILACAIENASEERGEEVHDALRSLAGDARGPRAWARDALERRRLGRDIGTLEKFTSEEDRRWEQEQGEARDKRRRQAHDGAYDSSPRGEFERMYPHAAKIERMG